MCLCASYGFRSIRERLVGEREGAARAWESSLRTEQAAAQQALLEAGTQTKRADDREAALKEAEEARWLGGVQLQQGINQTFSAVTITTK